MPKTSENLSYPRKFDNTNLTGRIENADTYAEVTIYPTGHWVLGTHTSMAGGVNISGTCVNYSFVLYKDGYPKPFPDGRNGVSHFGMPADHMWCVAPKVTGGPDDRYDTISGDFPADLLDGVDKVGLVITPSNKPVDLKMLTDLFKEIGQTGSPISFGLTHGK